MRMEFVQFIDIALPSFFLLALLIPVIIIFIIVRCWTIYAIIVDAKIKRRIFWTALTLVAAHLFLLSDALAAVLGLEYIEYAHIRRGVGIVTIIGTYFMISSLIAEALYYSVRKGDRKGLLAAKRLFQWLIGTLIAVLAVSLILTEKPFWELFTFATALGLLFLFFVSNLIAHRLKMALLDPATQNFLKYLHFILLMYIYAVVNTVLILLKLPPAANIFGIPIMTLVLYGAFRAVQSLIETRRAIAL